MNQAKHNRRVAALVLAGLLVATGCAGSSDNRTAKVTGKVTVGGNAVTAGTLLLVSDDGRAASAELDPDGTYTAICQPGQYKVAVTPPPPPDPLAMTAGAAPPKASQPQIPMKYQDFSRSGLTVELTDGDNKFDVSLAR